MKSFYRVGQNHKSFYETDVKKGQFNFTEVLTVFAKSFKAIDRRPSE